MLMAMFSAMLMGSGGEARPWRDEVVYVVILEKFFDGDASNNVMLERFGKDRHKYQGGFWGGDLKGVIARLDDLADLGVTAILLYPVMQNDEKPIGKFLPTGYRPRDYEQVDRNFGDIATLRSLVDAAHARDMKVILDMPITLPGFEHPYLADPAKKGWFGPPSEYGVPRWKVENPEVADFLIGVAKRWKERSGCDGFRIDSAHLQPVAFWKRFVAEVKGAPPEKPFVIVPELTITPREIGKFVTEGGFDGAYDFSIFRARDVFGKDHDVAQLAFIAREAKQFYPRPSTLFAAVDNYEDAFLSVAKEPKGERLKLALTYILTHDRVPLLYAGNELGIGFHEVGAAFPEDRRNSPFLKDVKALIAMRKREPALRRGDFAEILAKDAMYAYERAIGEDRILVVLNTSNQPREFAQPIGGRPWKSLTLDDLIVGGEAKPEGHDTPLRLEPFGARVVKVR